MTAKGTRTESPAAFQFYLFVPACLPAFLFLPVTVNFVLFWKGVGLMFP
jgi:hypothetical protein